MIERIYILESVDPVIFYGVNNVNMQLIKTLFPKPFEGLDYSTLKNLKAPCSNDVIPIDEPDNGRHDFHDVTEKTSE